jgi:hypothetical protein
MFRWNISEVLDQENEVRSRSMCVIVACVALPAGTVTVSIGPVTTPIGSSAVPAVSATVLIHNQ